jgi:lantibiotic leader peptide-processing serine protease
MKKLVVFVSLLAILATGLGAPAQAAPASTGGGRYIVLFANPNAVPANAAELVAQAGGSLVHALPQVGMGFAASADPAFAANMMRQPGVAAVTTDPLTQWLPADRLGDTMTAAEPGAHDPAAAAFFPFQWNMRAIHAHDAWAAGFQGNPAVTVAILDTGIDPAHLDLAGKVDASRSHSFVTSIEGLPECDDSALIDAFFPGQPDWIDLHWHGTHVGGTVASNSIGTASVAPHVTLTAVKVLNVCGFGLWSWIINGIVFAANTGADVINMSLGAHIPRSCRFEDEPRGPIRDECAALLSALGRATNYASSRGTLVISSAGNAGLNMDQTGDLVAVPAESPNVVAVSATGPIAFLGVEPDTPASYTNFGRSLVDVAAPGGDFRRFDDDPDWFFDMVLGPCSGFSLVIGCAGGTSYVFAAGTSMAAPHASGVAALADSNHGGGLNAAQLRHQLLRTADNLGSPGMDLFYGHGRVNAFRAATGQ